MLHENAALNAALGYTAATGKPSATAAHVDVGTQHYGSAIHTAWRAGLPVVITAGAPPTGLPGTRRGARDGGHFWLQDMYDQNGIVRQYMKWEHRLESLDNPGLIVSRALQVARTPPYGPVFLCFPREVALAPLTEATFPTPEVLGIGMAARARSRGRRPDRRTAHDVRQSGDRGGEFRKGSRDGGAAGRAVRAPRASGRRRGVAGLSLLSDGPSAVPGGDEPQSVRRRPGARRGRAVGAGT